ncbi:MULTISPECIES: serine/threonine-protein kinase [unclassified Saccharothrix]|uniref:serine/threonine-protein kinase n=1 Tax=unclassified Saccharothrix TaxID=2593673 RepID=UPI00307EF7A9
MEEFGPYRVGELLGRGGMGEVHRAHDTAHDRVVALKRLSAEHHDDPEFRARFRREARIAARLREPHVIPIHAFGEIDGRLYLDMRLVEGRDLAEVLRDGPLDPARAVRVVTQVAGALDAAHTDGLVHRDVKPSNILVTPDDFVYLVDFGIARSVLPGTGHLTASGAVVGTLDYMAPERFGDGPVDGRADVYALACVLYACVTGGRPFEADSAAALIWAHLQQAAVPPSSRNPAVPRALDEVIRRGMAKAPRDRFPTAGALASAAAAALATTPPAAAPGTTPPASAPGTTPPAASFGSAPPAVSLGTAPPAGSRGTAPLAPTAVSAAPRAAAAPLAAPRAAAAPLAAPRAAAAPLAMPRAAQGRPPAPDTILPPPTDNSGRPPLRRSPAAFVAAAVALALVAVVLVWVVDWKGGDRVAGSGTTGPTTTSAKTTTAKSSAASTTTPTTAATDERAAALLAVLPEAFRGNPTCKPAPPAAAGIAATVTCTAANSRHYRFPPPDQATFHLFADRAAQDTHFLRLVEDNGIPRDDEFGGCRPKTRPAHYALYYRSTSGPVPGEFTTCFVADGVGQVWWVDTRTTTTGVLRAAGATNPDALDTLGYWWNTMILTTLP